MFSLLWLWIFFIIANVSVFLEKGDIPMNEQYESQTQITYYQKKSKALTCKSFTKVKPTYVFENAHVWVEN